MGVDVRVERNSYAVDGSDFGMEVYKPIGMGRIEGE
jgi:hypothetical protein